MSMNFNAIASALARKYESGVPMTAEDVLQMAQAARATQRPEHRVLYAQIKHRAQESDGAGE